MVALFSCLRGNVQSKRIEGISVHPNDPLDLFYTHASFILVYNSLISIRIDL